MRRDTRVGDVRWPSSVATGRVYTLPPVLGTRPPSSGPSVRYMTMANERTTEGIVRDFLRTHCVPGQVLEEQTSADNSIKRALSLASKSGAGLGRPEFILRIPDAPNLVVIIECKASIRRHRSPKLDRPTDFAVDGALRYARQLASKFDVIALGVSGTDAASLRVDTFRQLQGSDQAEPLMGPGGAIKRLIPVAEYHSLLTFDPDVRARTYTELIAFSRVLHNFMRDYAKLSESEKPLVVSGILLALQDDAFKLTWPRLNPKHLARELFSAIERQAEVAGLDAQKRRVMLAPYSFITTHPELSKKGKDGSDEPLRRLVSDISEHVQPFIDTYQDVDVLGQFYGEFLRYTGGDKKGLGIVLTPRHLTELFAHIAQVGPQDTVVDTCAGTGGFLIAAMTEMDRKAGQDPQTREDIRAHRLVGVEQQPHMFALAVCNMILRGDGKANLYQGSCFEPQIQESLVNGSTGMHAQPNVGLINPPFSQKGAGLHELDFVEALLASLVPSGRAVAVLPMSCAIEPHSVRTRLLQHHTLVAVMSLPNDLFTPVGVIACAMVFEAHRPHATAEQKTWFGYWKDDGYVKTKDRGRIDLYHRWPDIRDSWLSDFHNRRVRAGRSVMRKVGPDDEWCAEAYMKTDYKALTQSDFERQLMRYAVYKALHTVGIETQSVDDETDDDD